MTDSKDSKPRTSSNKNDKASLFDWIEKASEVAGRAVYNAKTSFDQSGVMDKVDSATDKLGEMIRPHIEREISKSEKIKELEKRISDLEIKLSQKS